MSQSDAVSTLGYDPDRELDPQLHTYQLDAQLQQDCILLGRFVLCDLLLMNDANYPWFILVPRRPDISELYHLSTEDQNQLVLESSILSIHLADIFNAHKLNVAALGNIVRQFHLHHVVRYPEDPAWPAPVWGKAPAKRYASAQIEALSERVNSLLEDCAEYHALLGS